MHRIDGAGHVGNRFVAEDPATNRPPTEVTEAILNAFQEELAGFIEWAGLVLNKADDSQLKQGLLAKFALLELSATHGQCRLALSGSNLKLSPFNGNKLMINGAVKVIPSAGVTIASAGLIPLTLYYVYAYINSGAIALELSTTGHSVDTTTGVEIKAGDVTRSLVGMIKTITGPAFADTAAQRFVISWFNRQHIGGSSKFSTNRSTASATFVELNTEIRNEFLTWSTDAVTASLSGSAHIDAPANYFSFAAIGYDGVSVLSNAVARWWTADNNTCPISIADTRTLAEGYHYITVVARVSNAAITHTFNGGALTDDQTTLQIKLNG